MKRFVQILLAGLFVALVVEIIILAPRDIDEGQGKESAEPVVEMEQEGIDQTMRSVHLVETHEGGKEWELWADEAVSFKEKEVWALDKVKAVFFGEDGVYFTVTGDRGQVEIKTKNMVVEGNVVTKSSNGYEFRAPKVSYSSQRRQLVSPGEVEMYGPKDANGHTLFLRGKLMTADLNSSSMVLEKDVSGAKTFEGDRRVTIRSQRAKFSGNKRMAHFEGNVIMDLDTMRITGPQADFVYDDNTDLVRSVDVKGGVKVSDLDKWATSQTVKVNFEQDRYTFRGNPRVVQNNDELVGEEIQFLEGGKRVVVQKARARVDKQRMENVN